MTNTEREQFKDNLRSMIAGRGDGIDLDTNSRWVLSGVTQPETFFRNLHLLVPPDTVLYFEGCSIAPDVSRFYELNRARNAVAVVRDTIFPVPACFHVSFSPEVVARVCELVAAKPLNELFDHLKAYRGESLLFAFHDAFSTDLLISEHITESAIPEFSTVLGATFRREPNVNKRDPEQLRKFLWALENPRKVRIAGESWWKRLWRRWSW